MVAGHELGDAQAGQQPGELAHGARIELGGGFVEKQDLGGMDQGAGQSELLLHGRWNLRVRIRSLPLARGRLALDLGDLASRASSVVDITIDKNTLDWALQAKKSQGMNADEMRELMKELESFTIKVLDFKEAEKAPSWDDLQAAARNALNELDSPRWQSIVSVTERTKERRREELVL
jgi:hypothetical protein